MLYLISEGDVYIKMKSPVSEIEPMGNYVHIRPLEDTVRRVTLGGIALPDQAIERPCKGVVVSIGKGQRLAGGTYKQPPLKVGDIVRYRSNSAFVISFKDLNKREDEVIVPYGDILLREIPEFDDIIRNRLSALKDQGDS
jgi:chaperonin GroES